MGSRESSVAAQPPFTLSIQVKDHQAAEPLKSQVGNSGHVPGVAKGGLALPLLFFHAEGMKPCLSGHKSLLVLGA